MKAVGTAQIAAAMAVWSSWGLFIRWLPVPPWQVTFYVAVVSWAASAGWWLAAGGRTRDLWPRERRGLLAAQAVLFLANGLLFLTAYERTTVANAVLTHYTAPVFVAALAPLLLGERLLPKTPLAVALAGAGMFLLLPGLDLSAGSRHLQGILMGTGSGLAYALLVLLARHLSPRVPAPLLVFYQNLAASAALLPWAATRSLPPSGRTWGALLVLGLVHSTAAAFLYLAGIRKVRAQTAAVLGYLEPLGAVTLAALFLGERPGALGLLGGGLILAGGGLVVSEDRDAPA